VGIVSWVIFGLLAGAVARLLVPGATGIGCLATLAVGLVGAVIGGLIGEVLLGHHVRFGWRLGPFLLAVLGSFLLLLLLRVLSDGRSRRV